MYHTLHLKSILYSTEVLQWRGSILVNLLKAAASDPTSCENSRGIALADFHGKVHHKGLRDQLTPCLLNQALETQFGGLPGRGTDVASHVVRALIHDAVLNHKCLAILFADLSAAFYTVIRQLVSNIRLDDLQLSRLFARLKIPPEAIEELRAKVAEKDALSKAGVSDHARHLIADIGTNTYFHTGGAQHHLQQPHRHSGWRPVGRPGF